MARTRCEVRLHRSGGRGAVVGARARDRRVLHLAEPRRGPAAAGADRVGRRAVADHAGAQDAGLDRRARQDAHLRRGRRRHRRGGGGRGRGSGSRRWRSGSRCSASRTCRRSPPTARTHFRIAKSVRRDRTSTGVTRLDGPEREEEMARMMGGADVSADRPRERPRDARDATRSRRGKGESECKAKGESESRGRGNTSSKRSAAR